MTRVFSPAAIGCWVVITGEYPPDPGGVSDYSRLAAEALAAQGYRVAVFAPGTSGGQASETITINRLPRGFSRKGLIDLGHAMDALPGPKRILVQYVPHALGMISVNLPFCFWLRSLPDPVDVMFHEVASPWGPSESLRDNALGAVHRLMARLVGRAAARVFVSAGAWEPLLRGLGVDGRIELLPVPSNLPTESPADRIPSARARLDPTGHGPFLGHFGTLGSSVAQILAKVLNDLLKMVPRAQVVLVGRGGMEFARHLASRQPHLAHRLHATGDLPPALAAEHLAACDLLLQPYPDGVTTRRGSLMAGLALGIPVVSNRGTLTEQLWAQTDGLALAATPREMAKVAAALLADPNRLRALGGQGAALYRNRFHVSHTVDGLLADWN